MAHKIDNAPITTESLAARLSALESKLPQQIQPPKPISQKETFELHGDRAVQTIVNEYPAAELVSFLIGQADNVKKQKAQQADTAANLDKSEMALWESIKRLSPIKNAPVPAEKSVIPFPPQSTSA